MSGSFDTYMTKHHLSVHEKLWVMKQMASGLAHLHSSGIVHRDIAARNLLVAAKLDSDKSIKITDFGMSRLMSDENDSGSTKSNIGPIRWMSPEAISKRVYSFKSDVWAFGATCIEIFLGKPPFHDIDMLEVAVGVRDGSLQHKIPDECPEWLREILLGCFQMRPKDRPKMDDVATAFDRHVGEETPNETNGNPSNAEKLENSKRNKPDKHNKSDKHKDKGAESEESDKPSSAPAVETEPSASLLAKSSSEEDEHDAESEEEPEEEDGSDEEN